MKNKFVSRFLIVAFIVAFWSALHSPTPAFAADITVNTTADEFGAGADCSLREAIQAANTDAAFGGCTAGSGDDVINLPVGTYTLARTGADDTNVNGDLDITSNITVVGAGAGQTIIDAGGATGIQDRVLHILSGNVTLQNLIVRGGNVAGGGGGILQINGSLTIENSVIRNNSATGPTGNGGGIARTAGSLTITNSSLEQNSSSARGGGLYAVTSTGGSVTVTGATFSNNVVNGGGGGALFLGTDPITPSTGAAATLFNVTMSGNSVPIGTGGGAIWVRDNGTLTLTNSTVHGNTAVAGAQAIRQQTEGSITLNNVIVSGTGTACTGTITANNLLANDSTCGATVLSVSNFDVSLRNNGGPTQTHALLPGSNAIDAGNNATCASADQRNLPRPVDYDRNGTPTCDIGAFERQATETFTATVNEGGTQTFGATLTTIVDNAGGNAPGIVTVVRQNQPPGGGAPDPGEMPFHVNITAATSTGLDINLTLCYTDWEWQNPQGNSVTESGLTFYRWNGSTWDDQGVDALNTTGNCATKNNITSLSSWTLASGPPAPTAVSLQSFTADNPANGLIALTGAAALILFTGLIVLRRRPSKA